MQGSTLVRSLCSYPATRQRLNGDPRTSDTNALKSECRLREALSGEFLLTAFRHAPFAGKNFERSSRESKYGISQVFESIAMID